MKKLLVLTLLLAGCATGPNVYQQELLAYRSYLQSEIAAGRMTRDQGNYMLYAKQRELQAQQSAAVDSALRSGAAGLGAAGAYAPRPIPQNQINCTTYQRGYNGTISCQ